MNNKVKEAIKYVENTLFIGDNPKRTFTSTPEWVTIKSALQHNNVSEGVYVVLKDNQDIIYGVEYGVLYTVIGYTNCCYIIKNNSGTTVEVNRKQVTEVHNLKPRCIEKEIDTTVKNEGLGKRYV